MTELNQGRYEMEINGCQSLKKSTAGLDQLRALIVLSKDSDQFPAPHSDSQPSITLIPGDSASIF